MECKICHKQTDVLAEGMCVSCYEKSEVAKTDTASSVFGTTEKLQQELNDLLKSNAPGQAGPSVPFTEKWKALIHKKSFQYSFAGSLVALIALGVVGYYYLSQPTPIQTSVVNTTPTPTTVPSVTPEPAEDGLADTDKDKIPDAKEEKFKTDPNKADTDGDGVSDYDEIVLYHTDPTEKDSDKDGLNDGEEIILGTEPLMKDGDKDHLSDGEEVNQYKTNPQLIDTDGDGVNDGDEVKAGTDPLK